MKNIKWMILFLMMCTIVGCAKQQTTDKDLADDCVLPCLFSLRVGDDWEQALPYLELDPIENTPYRYIDDNGNMSYIVNAIDIFKQTITSLPEREDSLWTSPDFTSGLSLSPSKNTPITLKAVSFGAGISEQLENISEASVLSFQHASKKWFPEQLFRDLGVPNRILIDSVPYGVGRDHTPSPIIRYTMAFRYDKLGVAVKYRGYTNWDDEYEFCFQYEKNKGYLYALFLEIYDINDPKYIPSDIYSTPEYTFDVTEVSSYTPTQLVKDFLENVINCFSIPRDTWKAEGER